ncbi:reprolysin-like metallopeptidase [Winogradskyella sp. Asnod2-B02-A]|uniref:reprolysin-like metallopeptidase n=1 Tax=Winogradskyella sp. Asnod2-B02-A TaxID=3160583 RepID=UPI00386C25F9
MNKQITLALVLILLLLSMGLFAQNNFWTNSTSSDFRSTLKERVSMPSKHRTIALNTESFLDFVSQARGRFSDIGANSLVISLPMPNGENETFTLEDSELMHPELAAKFPELKTYSGKGITDRTASLRITYSPYFGFSGMVMSGEHSTVYIDPITSDNQHYMSYFRNDLSQTAIDFQCTTEEAIIENVDLDGYSQRAPALGDCNLRRYRLAQSCNGEYAQYHIGQAGGTTGTTAGDKAIVQAAMNVTMNRVNGIYERDLGITMQMVANNDLVIYLDASTDPWTNEWNTKTAETIDAQIGVSNYDIGHNFNTTGGGNAGCIDCVCLSNSQSNTHKGRGYTGRTAPVGDPFDIDYVAHEMGHQFGGYHVQSNNSCRSGSGSTEVETGSGSTIMGYAGICAANVQNNSDDYFAYVNIRDIVDTINFGNASGCAELIASGNSGPEAVAGLDYSIPASTPFRLEGTGSDPDDTGLTYCWEQNDPENPGSNDAPVSTRSAGPMFRSFAPVAIPYRYFPNISAIISNTTPTFEVLPSVSRSMDFSFIVRDNNSISGCTASDLMTVTTVASAGPFIVTAPNTNVTWNAGTLQDVTWDVAGTTAAPISCSNVDIFLSTDGGNTYPITLATGVANNGTYSIVVPNNQGTQNRIMVKASNNIFFDISDANFTIGVPIVCNADLPINLVASNVSFDSATISWDEVSGAAYDLRYREVGSSTWTTISVAALSYNLTGLNSETDYEAQIRSKCTDGATSAYSSSVLFTTTEIPPCSGTQITTFPYLETFDAGIGEWTQATGDDGDWTLNSGDTLSTGTGPSNDITGGGNYFYTEASTDGLDANATVMLVSPCFDLSTATTETFSFYYHMLGDDMGSLNLEVTIDDGGNWTNVFSVSGEIGDVWNSQNIDISSYYGEVIKFRFIGLTGNGWSSDIAIDHIGIGDPITDNIAPVITLNGDSIINLIVGSTYTELGATATDNFDGDITSSIVIGGDTVDSNTLGTYLVTYNVSDTAGNAAAEVIRTVNVVEATYCDSSGNTSFETGVTRVIFGTIDNVDGSPKDVGYEDFTNISTEVLQGTNVDLTVHVDTDGNYTVHTFVWIDWNQDADFDDVGEEYDLGDITNVDDGAMPTLAISIPESMIFGNTRMRVSTQYNANPTACNTNFDGEVEDYTVNVKYDGLLFSEGTWEPNAPSNTTVTDNALILNGTYTVGSNIALNNLTVNDIASIIVLEGESIELEGNLVNNGGVILNSSSTEYSSLIVNGNVTGDVIYKRHVNIHASSGENDLISAPVTGQTFGVFAAANANIVSNPNTASEKLFGPFDKATETYLTYDTNVSADASIILNPGIGYRSASTDDGTFEFSGTVNTGVVSMTILNAGTTYPEWNLIGNPYPSYIKLSDFLSTNINEFLSTSAAIYGYDGDTSNGWKICNLAYAAMNPNSIITPGQGFLVSSKAGGGTMTFAPSFRATASGDPQLDDDFIDDRENDSSEIAYLKLAMNSNLNSYSADFYFTDLASSGLDVGYDATAFNGIAPDYAIYSHLVENSTGLDMSIQSVSFNDLNNSLIIPLGINATQGEQITVSMPNITLPTDVEVYLEDNLTNTFTLLNSNDYSFTPSDNLSGTGRFYLRFEAEALDVNDNELNTLLVYTSENPKQIIIEGILENTTKAALYDVQGREVLSQSLDVNKNLQSIDVNNLSAGVYIIYLQSTTRSLSRKIIIK